MVIKYLPVHHKSQRNSWIGNSSNIQRFSDVFQESLFQWLAIDHRNGKIEPQIIDVNVDGQGFLRKKFSP